MFCFFFFDCLILIVQMMLLLTTHDGVVDDLPAKAIESAALALEGIDNVQRGHRLALGMLGVGDGIADHVLQEDLEHTAGLLIDQARDTLDTATASQTADGGLGDALDVVTKNLAMALGSTLAQTLASFATTRHSDAEEKEKMMLCVWLWRHLYFFV